ncbi:MAG: recombination mediator RecR [Chlamydiia bacterium]
MAKYPQTMNTLISFFRKFSGVGTKTAERYAFQALNWNQTSLTALGELLLSLKEKIQSCKRCGCLIENLHCTFCDKGTRQTHTLCIISSAKDVYPIEETGVYKGLYHVLGGLLSPLDGRTPKDLQIDQIKERMIKDNIQDVILALDSTLEGDATALYLKEQINRWGGKVSRPAMGMPMGSSLDYVDGGTLAKAFIGRQNF